MKYYVYLHVTADSGVIFYVGKGSGSRLRSTHNRNQHWVNMVNKHGFIPFIIAYFHEESEAYDFEKLLIEKLGRKINGGILVNVTEGGEGTNGGCSEEKRESTREKRSNAMKRRWRTPEYRECMLQNIRKLTTDDACLRRKSENSKKMWESEEYRKTISEIRKLGWKDPEQRKRRMDKMKDADYRKNQSEKKKGRNSPKWKGDIAMISPTGEVVGVFESAASCHETTGANSIMVCRKLKSKEPVKGGKFVGFRFEYVNLLQVDK